MTIVTCFVREPYSIIFNMAGQQWYVYQYIDPRPDRNGSIIYVGKGQAKRCNDHLRDAKNPLLRRVLAKIQDDGLAPTIEIVGWFSVEEDAYEMEKILIARYGRRDIGTGTLCNLTPGGEGSCGYRYTPEQSQRLSEIIREQYASGRRSSTWSLGEWAKVNNAGRVFTDDHRKKLSQAKMGVRPSDETFRRLSEATKGRARPQETKEKIAAALKGHDVSEETRRKISEANRGRAARPWTEEQKLRMIETRKRNKEQRLREAMR